MGIEALAKLKAAYRGKKTFVLGNGPSLVEHDLVKLQEPTFGINRSFFAHRSDFHVVADPVSAVEHEEQLRKLPCVFGVDSRAAANQEEYMILLHDLGTDMAWSRDPVVGVYPRSSPYIALQLATWMGFGKVVLLGTDLCEHKGKRHFHSIPAHRPIDTMVTSQLKSFGFAADKLRDSNTKVYNCSPSNVLQAFPRITFEEALAA